MCAEIPTGLIEGVDVVSFDVFDTLVKRNVNSPYDVFDIVQQQAQCRTGIDCRGFAKARVAAERAARRECRSEEVNLEDIYSWLSLGKPWYPTQALRDIECEVEVNVAIANVPVFRFYEECLERGVRVVATSDMYLPKETIRELLENCGYARIEEVFVSSEVGLRKSSGRLFQYVAEALSVAPRRLLHIGDNPDSDVRIPQTLGCRAYLIDKAAEPSLTMSRHGAGNNTVMEAYLRNTATGHGFFERVGREVLGPVLLGFSKWLHEYVEERNPDAVVFLSRDGAIMKRAYERAYGPDPRVRYAYCSRRGIIVPTLWDDCTPSALQERIHFKRRMKLGDVLDRVGLSADDYASEISSAGLSREDEVDGTRLADDERVAGLLVSLGQDIRDNATRERDCALEYWRDLVGESESIFIVDIGWNGNMQRALSSLLTVRKSARRLRIAGFYLGVNPWSEYDGEMHGYLFESGDHEKLADRMRYFMSVVELVFMAEHGSLRRYEPHRRIALCQYEYGDASPESKQTGAAIKAIQAGALDFVEEYGSSCLNAYAPVTRDNARDALFALGEKPTAETAARIGDCLFLNAGLEHIAQPTSGRFRYDEFVRSSWRVGYLQRCLNRNLPYGMVVSLMAAVSSLSNTKK